MNFPRYLYNSYQSILECSLVKCKDYSDKSLREFETLLNNAQPTEQHTERFNTVKAFYNANKYRFQQFVRNTEVECTMLWTESKTIVNWLRLRGIVYLNYNAQAGRYSVQLHRQLETAIRGGTAPAFVPARVDTRVDLELDDLPLLDSLVKKHGN